jgi:hypothetical protein
LPEVNDNVGYDLYVRHGEATPKRTHVNVIGSRAAAIVSALYRFAPTVKVMLIPTGKDIWGA